MLNVEWSMLNGKTRARHFQHSTLNIQHSTFAFLSLAPVEGQYSESGPMRSSSQSGRAMLNARRSISNEKMWLPSIQHSTLNIQHSTFAFLPLAPSDDQFLESRPILLRSQTNRRTCRTTAHARRSAGDLAAQVAFD